MKILEQGGPDVKKGAEWRYGNDGLGCEVYCQSNK
jgi:hypothetical protein